MGPVRFTATSGQTFSSYTDFDAGATGRVGYSQGAKIVAWAEGAALASSVSVPLVLYDESDEASPVKEVITLTVENDANSRRTGPAGNNGHYLCKVTADKGSENKVDLLGAGDRRKWRIGLNGALPGSTTALNIQGFPSSVI